MSRADESAATLAAELSEPASSPEGTGDLLAGRYRVLELLGSGGMGTVYRARDVELDEVVALKTLRREVVATPGALERFRREVKLARKVTHRSIARVFDVGEHVAKGKLEGEKFLTMELVEGRSLGRLLAERRHLSPGEAVPIAIAICEGLGAAHAAGVVHRDLKPDNVLLEAGTGRVVLTDFGVARAIAGGDARATSAGGIVGTPAYMAPEQVDGSEVDGRTDLYALGVVLFEMLSGELPFEGETALALAAARLVRPPRDLRALRPDVPPALADAVVRALARSRDGRFETAGAMATALAGAASATLLRAAAAPEPPPVPQAERRIAVVPFRAQGDDAGWLAEGLVEDLSDALSMLRGVRVRARTGAPGEGEDLRAFAARHDVEALVEGTLRRESDRIRATVRLVSAADGFQIWARRFDGSIGDALRVSDEAAQAIAGALAGARAPAQRPPLATGAVELYLRARKELTSFSTTARELLEQARALAPDDPRILSALASALAGEVFRPGAPRAVLDDARQAALRAIEIAPDLADPHVALARVRFAEGDVTGAVEASLAAVHRGPSEAAAHDVLGRILAEIDALPEATAHLERCLWIDPSQLFPRIDLARTHLLLGRLDAARRELDEVRARQPSFAGLLSVRLALWLRRPDWILPIEEAPLDTLHGYHAITRKIAAGQALEAADWKVSAELIAGTPPGSRSRRFFHQLEAELRLTAGEADRGIEHIEASVAAGLVDLAWLRRCPTLAPIRERPEYAVALATVEARVEPALAAYRARRSG